MKTNAKQILVAALVVTAFAGLGSGYLATQYLGKDASIAIGAGVFGLGAVATVTTIKPKLRRKTNA